MTKLSDCIILERSVIEERIARNKRLEQDEHSQEFLISLQIENTFLQSILDNSRPAVEIVEKAYDTGYKDGINQDGAFSFKQQFLNSDLP